MKIIDAIRRSAPEGPTYGDSVAVIDSGNVLFEGAFSTEPNPRGLSGANKGKSWMEYSARIAEGEYSGVVMQHPKFGKCILLENGGRMKTVNPNHNHKGEYWAAEVFIHNGYSDTCRGSLACQTVPPKSKAAFWVCFKIGEKITYKLRGEVK